MNRCLVVLGMHRSGTSCVTRMLHHLGVYLGENYCTEPMPSNLIGHWEARDVVEINDQILSHSGGSWQSVPERLSWNDDCEQQIKRVLTQFAQRPLCGWKDPRTTITFPAWKRHLSDYVVLACLRHPLAVAQSLEVRDGFDIARGLRLWTTYNRHLLALLAGERNVFWFPYDEPQSVLQEHLLRLCEHLQLPFDEEAASLFNLLASQPRRRPGRGRRAACPVRAAVGDVSPILERTRRACSFPIVASRSYRRRALGLRRIERLRHGASRACAKRCASCAAQQMQTRRMLDIERTSAERLRQIQALDQRPDPQHRIQHRDRAAAVSNRAGPAGQYLASLAGTPSRRAAGVRFGALLARRPSVAARN